MRDIKTEVSLNTRAWILAFLTVGLLFLYAWSTSNMIRSALSCNAGANTLNNALNCQVSQRLATLTMTLQSLVSAVVIAVLAISPVKGPLNLLHFGISPLEESQSIVALVLALCYLVVWFIVGAAALGVGYIVLDDPTAAKFSALIDVGGSWLGLAVGAVYAYFGMDQKERPSSG